MIRAGWIAVVLVCWIALAAGPAPAETFTLDAVRAQVKTDHAGLAQLSTAALAEALDRDEALLLIDVREEAEFAVSRIPGAQRVDPGAWTGTFLKEYGDKARGKRVVFYCAVGVRSSGLAARVEAGLKERGALAVYNLDGGIFAWHNEGRALADAHGATRFVHPYDSHWGQLVEHAELTRTAPAR